MLVAVGRGCTEVGVGVIEGAVARVSCTGAPVGDVVGAADGTRLGTGVVVDAAVGAGLDVSVIDTTGVAIGWTVKSRAIAVRGGTVGINGSGVNSLGWGAG